MKLKISDKEYNKISCLLFFFFVGVCGLLLVLNFSVDVGYSLHLHSICFVLLWYHNLHFLTLQWRRKMSILLEHLFVQRLGFYYRKDLLVKLHFLKIQNHLKNNFRETLKNFGVVKINYCHNYSMNCVSMFQLVTVFCVH